MEFMQGIQKAKSVSNLVKILNKEGYTKKVLDCYVNGNEELIYNQIKAVDIRKHFLLNTRYSAKVVKEKLVKIFSKYKLNIKPT